MQEREANVVTAGAISEQEAVGEVSDSCSESLESLVGYREAELEGMLGGGAGPLVARAMLVDLQDRLNACEEEEEVGDQGEMVEAIRVTVKVLDHKLRKLDGQLTDAEGRWEADKIEALAKVEAIFKSIAVVPGRPGSASAASDTTGKGHHE